VQGLLDGDDSREMMFRKVAVKTGLQVRELEEVARRLDEVGLINRDTLQPMGWDVRQFVSDSSTPECRGIGKNARKTKRTMNVTTGIVAVTATKRYRNVSVTDQIQIQIQIQS